MVDINCSLDQIRAALEQINNPQDKYKSIIVAGTNGKGSTCTFLELMYQKYFPSLIVGKYLSPHVNSVTERISINSRNISHAEFFELWIEFFGLEDLRANVYGSDIFELNKYLDGRRTLPQPFFDLAKGKTKLTAFEKVTTVAYEYFARKKIDRAILEVGMGGRWDTTNVVAANSRLATALTNVSFDHMEYLGDTLEKIRAEKEAIRCDGVPHFELKDKNAEINPNESNGDNFRLAEKIFTGLNPQINISQADKDSFLESFKQRLPARFNFNAEKKILVDGAHNPDACRRLNKFICQNVSSEKQKIFLIGFLDKDIKNSLQNLFAGIELNENDIVILTEPDSSRSTKTENLQALLNCPCQVLAIKQPEEAIKYAYSVKSAESYLIVAGSLYLAAYLGAII